MKINSLLKTLVYGSSLGISGSLLYYVSSIYYKKYRKQRVPGLYYDDDIKLVFYMGFGIGAIASLTHQKLYLKNE